jgi:hypothetical protein
MRTRRWNSLEAWVILNTFFGVILFAFAGVADRFLPVLVPCFVLLTIISFRHIYLRAPNGTWKHTALVLIAVVLVIEFAYSFNTNTLRKPIGGEVWAYSPNKIRDLGFNRLEAYIRSDLIKELPKKINIRSKGDMTVSTDDDAWKVVVAYDDRISWFGQLWYLQKYLIYYRLPFLHTTYLAGKPDFLRNLMRDPERNVYYVHAVDAEVMDAYKAARTDISAVSNNLAQELEKAGVKSVDILNGEELPAFRVYDMKRK